MRLTYKNHKIEIAKKRKLFEKDVDLICEKLGQYEDIDDEIGVDYVTLFKALTQGAYFREWNNPMHPEVSTISFSSNVELKLDYDEKRFWLDAPFTFKRHYLDEYGVTWALTKDELGWNTKE